MIRNSSLTNISMRKVRNVLLHTDLQNDFFDDGALGAKGSLQITKNVNDLTKHATVSTDWIIVFSADKHPEETEHFNKWPKHCIENTLGSKFHHDVWVPPWAFRLHKGLGNRDDGYSPFDKNNVRIILPYIERPLYMPLGLLLHGLEAENLYGDGLVIHWCLRAGLMDSAKEGFKTYLIKDASAALENEDPEIDFKEMRDAGIMITDTASVVGGLVQ